MSPERKMELNFIAYLSLVQVIFLRSIVFIGNYNNLISPVFVKMTLMSCGEMVKV